MFTRIACDITSQNLWILERATFQKEVNFDASIETIAILITGKYKV